MVLLTLNPAKSIAKFPQVLRVYIIAGEWDMLLEVIEKDIEALGEFVVSKLRNVKGVSKTLTLGVLKRVKERGKISVNYLNSES